MGKKKKKRRLLARDTKSTWRLKCELMAHDFSLFHCIPAFDPNTSIYSIYINTLCTVKLEAKAHRRIPFKAVDLIKKSLRHIKSFFTI